MRKPLAGLGLGFVAILAIVVVYFAFIRSDAPDAFELSTDSSDSTDSDQPVDLEGTWTIGEGSQAGYRVVEDFIGGIQDFEAVGRGSDITGSLTIDGTTITTAGFTIDIASITSDDDRRDNKFTGDIMNAAEFPTAAFELTEPIELGIDPSSETAVSTSVVGELTLRGVTNTVPVVIDAQRDGGRIEIVGSIDVVFSDYGIANPSIERIIAVRDEGQVEFQLFVTK